MSDNLQDVKTVLLTICAYYNEELSDLQLAMWSEDLRQFNAEEIAEAFVLYRRNPKNIRMPKPAQLIGILCPNHDPISEGNEIASRISKAVSKFGYPDPKQAEEHIGPIGWNIVERFGGWQYICENLGTSRLNKGMAHAQFRDCAQAIVAFQKTTDSRKQISSGWFDKMKEISSSVRPQKITRGVT